MKQSHYSRMGSSLNGLTLKWTHGLTALGSLVCLLLPETADAATYSYYMPLIASSTPAGKEVWGMFGCSSPMYCVGNLDESFDESLDAGLFAKRKGQYVQFETNWMKWANAWNWSRATAVNSVELTTYMQATGTPGQQACTRFTAIAITNGGFTGRSTAQVYCNTVGEPAIVRQFPIDSPTTFYDPWTPQLLNETMFKYIVQRDDPAGARHYVAEVFVTINYDAP